MMSVMFPEIRQLIEPGITSMTESCLPAFFRRQRFVVSGTGSNMQLLMFERFSMRLA
jgi:hypothetical protein